MEINLTQEQFEKLKNIKSLLSHKVTSQNTADVLEVLFDQYLNKNSIIKEKGYDKSKNLTMKQSNSESVIIKEFKEKSNSTLSGTENESSNSSNPNFLFAKNQFSQNTETTITECFMESRVEINKDKSNLNSNINFNANINPTPSLNDDAKIKESEKSHKSKNRNNNINNQSSFKRTRYIPIHIRRKVFQRANHCCEFTGPNQERCQSRYQLEIDHFFKPYSQGGDHSLDNLKLHCSQHNVYRASRLGIGFETIKAHF